LIIKFDCKKGQIEKSLNKGVKPRRKMMKIMVNGEELKTVKSLTVAELLQERKIESPDMVSVEINEEILAKDAFATTLLQENDAVEFLYFMGGGSTGYERIRLKI
jgi:sulfur carrier protein